MNDLSVIDIDELLSEYVEAKPIDMDWSEGWGEQWEFFDADNCPECERIVVGSGWVECECGTGVSLDGPMMNYAYPVDVESLDEAVLKIKDLPLCLVETSNDGQYLALTGGGMDVSWEICEAYIRLGYLPPVHFELPKMAGRGTTPDDLKIIEASLRANRLVADWAERPNTRLVDMMSRAAERTL